MYYTKHTTTLTQTASGMKMLHSLKLYRDDILIDECRIGAFNLIDINRINWDIIIVNEY